MTLAMNKSVFITCAVTGSGGTQDRSPHVPRSPAEIADSAIAAAKAGAAIVHCHVRDPETGAPARDPKLYREVTDRIRDSHVDVVLNLTAGMGGDLVFGSAAAPLPLAEGTDMIGAQERLAHVSECLPEICTLDCGTMNFAEADYVMTNTPGMLQAMGRDDHGLGRACLKSKPSTPDIFGWPSSWFAMGYSKARRWSNCAWVFPGAHPTISTRSWPWSTTCRAGLDLVCVFDWAPSATVRGGGCTGRRQRSCRP